MSRADIVRFVQGSLFAAGVSLFLGSACLPVCAAEEATSQNREGGARVESSQKPESASSQLPDLLKSQAGVVIDSSEKWNQVRRPELKELIQREMYGYLPPSQPFVATVTKETAAFDGKATLKEISLRFTGLPEAAQEIRLAIWIPRQKITEKKSTEKVPVFLTLNYGGNANVTDDPQTTIHADRFHSRKENRGQRGTQKDFWCVEQVLDRGYAFATFHESDVKADQNQWDDGLFPYLKNAAMSAGSQPATICLWAWGLHRCIDQLVNEPEIDAQRICLLGHSRRGKAVLFAAAMDERVALVVPHQSGTGGMALSRDNQQETVERINRVFPHWFCEKFKSYDGNESQIPFDQHAVAALVAPRLLLDTEGDQDAWANFPRALDTIQAASPAWRLLGKTGVAGEGLLKTSGDLIEAPVGEIVQLRIPEKHTLTREFWTGILNFADRKMGIASPVEK